MTKTTISFMLGLCILLATSNASFSQSNDQRVADATAEIALLKRVVAEQDRRITELEKAVTALQLGTEQPKRVTDDQEATSAQPNATTTHRVTYEVTGTASSASVTITNASGGTEQRVVSLPWVTEFRAPGGRPVVLHAQNKGKGILKATIYIDGQLIQHAETTQQYGVAMASGRVPR